MLSVIAYIRVSTNNQGDNGISLNGQKAQIREFARINNLHIRIWCIDVDSARGEENFSTRKGFNEATELSLRKGWPIIAATADRFSRTLSSYDKFIEAGGKAYSADIGFGGDEAVMRGKIKRAQHDGDKLSSRTREGQALARANGKKFGNPDTGPARAKAFAVRQENKQIRYEEFRGQLDRVRELGAKTDTAVAKALNDNGYVTARGEDWTSANVARMRRRITSDGLDIEALSFDMEALDREIEAASLEPFPKIIAVPIFTADGRLTDDGFRRACDAYAELRGAEKRPDIERRLRRIKDQPWPAAQKAKLEDKIESVEFVREIVVPCADLAA